MAEMISGLYLDECPHTWAAISLVEEMPLRYRGEKGVIDVKLVALGTREAKEATMRPCRSPVRVVFCFLHAARIVVTSFADSVISLT